MSAEIIYNLTEVKNEIQKILGFRITYKTMYFWVKKGFITSKMRMKYGNRVMPIYTMKDIEDFLEIYPILVANKKIRKKYEKEKTN